MKFYVEPVFLELMTFRPENMHPHIIYVIRDLWNNVELVCFLGHLDLQIFRHLNTFGI
jgi:hypothetical protein